MNVKLDKITLFLESSHWNIAKQKRTEVLHQCAEKHAEMEEKLKIYEQHFMKNTRVGK